MPDTQVVGEFGLGEFVNRFQRGSLVMKLPDTEAARIPTVLFGTVNGAIGVVASLPKDRFEFLWRLQARPSLLARQMPGVVCMLERAVYTSVRRPAGPHAVGRLRLSNCLHWQACCPVLRPVQEAACLPACPRKLNKFWGLCMMLFAKGSRVCATTFQGLGLPSA